MSVFPVLVNKFKLQAFLMPRYGQMLVNTTYLFIQKYDLHVNFNFSVKLL